MNYFSLLMTSEFREPYWFLLLLLPLVSIVFHIYKTRRILPEQHFDANMRYWYINHNKKSDTARLSIFITNFLLWSLLSVVLAGPQYAEINQINYDQEKSAAILVLLDASASMNVSDIQPTRFIRAKNELLLLIDKLEPAQRMGVMMFSAKTHLLFSPTFDKEAMRYYLNILQPDMLPYAGTDIIESIKFASNFLNENHEDKKSTIIVISDGDIEHSKEALKSLTASVTEYNVSAVGVGKQIDAPVPAYDNEASQWMLDNNKPAFSSLNRSFLSQIASHFNGNYYSLSDNQLILSDVIKTSSAGNDLTQSNTQWHPLYQPFLLVALLVFFIRFVFLVN